MPPFTHFTSGASIGIVSGASDPQLRVLFTAEDAGLGHDQVYLWEPNVTGSGPQTTLANPTMRTAPRVTCLMRRLGGTSKSHVENGRVQSALSPDCQWAAVAVDGALSILKLEPTHDLPQTSFAIGDKANGNGDAPVFSAALTIGGPSTSSSDDTSENVYMSWSRDGRLLAITSLLEDPDPELLRGDLHFVYMQPERGEASSAGERPPLAIHWSESFQKLGLECAQCNALQQLEHNLYICGTFSGPCFNRRGALLRVQIQRSEDSLEVRVLHTISFERNGYALYPIAQAVGPSSSTSKADNDRSKRTHRCFVQIEYDWLQRTPEDANPVEWSFFYSVRRLELERLDLETPVVRYVPENAKQLRIEPLQQCAGPPLLHPMRPIFYAGRLVAIEEN